MSTSSLSGGGAAAPASAARPAEAAPSLPAPAAPALSAGGGGPPAGAGAGAGGGATTEVADDVREWLHEAAASSGARAAAERRPILKTALAAAALFALGSVMLWAGVQVLWTEFDRGVAMIVVGALAFIPGSYAVWNLVGAARGWRGYSYDHLPSYDD